MNNEKDKYIKEKLQKDKLISKKVEDVFNNFFKGDLNMEEDKKKESLKMKKKKKLLATVASLIIIFGVANVYASTQGYGNIFFMIKYLVTGEKVIISDKDEILSDKDISISYEPIKLTENIRMQIRNLQIKDNEAKLIIAVNETEIEEDLRIVPLKYKVYNSSNELLCEQRSCRMSNKEYNEYIEELILSNYKENDNILILEVYKANDNKIVKITIDLTKRDITIEGEQEALQKISEIKLKEYLQGVSAKENNIAEDEIERIKIVDIINMSYCDGLYTATFTYIIIPEGNSFDVDYNSLKSYEDMIYFELDEDSNFKLVKYEKSSSNINKSEENEINNTISKSEAENVLNEKFD